jgi:hypothetical protein
MGLGDFHRYRHFVSALALVGVLLYTALIPGHGISQATAFLLADELDAALELSCHEGMEAEGNYEWAPRSPKREGRRPC